MPSGVIKRGNSTSPHRNRSFAQLWTFIYRGFSITSFDYQRVLQKIMLVVVEVNMKKEPAKLMLACWHRKPRISMDMINPYECMHNYRYNY
jgi:hypothetical protein